MVPNLSGRRTEHRPQHVVPRPDPGRRVDAARALAVEGERIARRLQRFAAEPGRPPRRAPHPGDAAARTGRSTPEMQRRIAEYLGVTPED